MPVASERNSSDCFPFFMAIASSSEISVERHIEQGKKSRLKCCNASIGEGEPAEKKLKKEYRPQAARFQRFTRLINETKSSVSGARLGRGCG